MTQPKLHFLIFVVFTLLFLTPASFSVQNYDLTEITPQVQQAIENRRTRYAELQRLKQEGAVGESSQGFVETLERTAELSSLVEAENQDRGVIYQAIVDQNQLGPSGMAEVRRIFAEVQRGKALTGDYIQLPSGEWAKK